MSELVFESTPVGETAARIRSPRLLCMNAGGHVPHALLAEIARGGMEVMGPAENLDDTLRHAYMGYPDIIVMPYLGDKVLEFLGAIDHLRGPKFSPYVVLVSGDDHGEVIQKIEGCYRVSVLPRTKVAQQLIPHLRRIAADLKHDA